MTETWSPTPWVWVYQATRRINPRGPVSGDIVALVMLLEARGSQTVGQVGDALLINAGSASELVSRAQAAEWVVTTRHPQDKRVRIADLSPKSMQALRSAGSAYLGGVR